MKFGVVVFPGSNCDMDMVYVLETIMKQKVVKLWHKDTDLQECDFIILPGGTVLLAKPPSFHKAFVKNTTCNNGVNPQQREVPQSTARRGPTAKRQTPQRHTTCQLSTPLEHIPTFFSSGPPIYHTLGGSTT